MIDSTEQEEARLSALDQLKILDTSPEVAFDRIVEMAASIFAAPIAILSFVDRDRQWIKAARNCEFTQTPRDIAFCNYGIRSNDLCVIQDATADPRFVSNPLVTGSPYIRFYAGAPLVTRDGNRIGMLAVMDQNARRSLSEEEGRLLAQLAAIVMDEIELRNAKADLDDSVVMLQGAIDLAQRRQREVEEARKKAEAARDAKTAFLAHMSHELRTPLNGVIGLISLLLEESLSSQHRKFAEGIQQSADALLHIIGDILDASKLETNSLQLECRPASPADILHESLSIVSAAAAAKKLDISVIFDGNVPAAIEFDAFRVKQILLNLLSNAVKFADSGSVRARCHYVEGQLRFEIADDGPGIASDEQEAIFERFGQSSLTRSKHCSGSGLGLSIARDLVSLMGGHIGVRSEVGQGACFWFEFPAPSCEAPLESRNVFPCTVVLLSPDNEAAARTRAQLVQFGANLGKPGDEIAHRGACLVVDETCGELTSSLLKWIERNAGSLQVLIAPGYGLLSPLPSLFSEISCYRLKLPLWHPGSALEIAEYLAPQSAPKGNDQVGIGRHVLLAEDDATSAEIATAILRKAGCQVTRVSNGMDSVLAAANYPFDIILMDLNMPQLSGFDAIAKIRAIHGDKGPPIYAISASATIETLGEIKSSGFDGYLFKPFTPDALRALIRDAFTPPSEQAGSSGGLLNDAYLTSLERSLGRKNLQQIASKWKAEFMEDFGSARASAAAGEPLERIIHKMIGAASFMGSVAIVSALEEWSRTRSAADADKLGLLFKKTSAALDRRWPAEDLL